MKQLFLSLLLALILVVVAGCDSEPADGIKMPFSASACKGENYQEVVADLEEAGFTNVQVEILDDLIIGFLTEDGEVEQVTINGDTTFSTDTRCPKDAEIVVTYHTFPQADEDSGVSSSEDKEENQSRTYETSSLDTIDENPRQPEIITTENNKEFLDVVEVLNERDPIIEQFVEKYKGRLIEFDGCIIFVDSHENYNTRYDILLSAGDYINENTANPGPLFKMEDVNVTDMGIKELYIPQFIRVGSNVRIVSKVTKYDNDRGLLMLDPVLVEAR